MRVGYLVHDVNDAAVARRVAMFEEAGVATTLGGFRRRDFVPAAVGGAAVVDLGRTADGRLGQRALAVLRNALAPAAARRATAGRDVIVARNLESLIVAQRARRPGQRLVYECLDIHRLLLGEGAPARAVQAAERWALSDVDLIVVSSPHFADDYFRDRRHTASSVLLVENKVPAFAVATLPPAPPAPSPGPPWVIGWFGMLRCKRSLAALGRIARAAEGRIAVLIAGRASDKEFADFDAEVAAMPHVRYAGPYVAADLPALYGQCHFAWAIDYFEEGLNSRWLLPNRLYEGLAHGTVPIALGDVATGQWLARHDAGVMVADPVAEVLAMVAAMTPDRYAALRGRIDAIPRGAISMTRDECLAIVDRICGRAA